MSYLHSASGRGPASNSRELIDQGREVLHSEIRAIERLSEQLDETFVQAVEILLGCRGCVVVSGMGKAGIIGQKLAASFSSTGTPSHFLHPAEAVHGDLGCIRESDIVILLSYSGETEEITRLLPTLAETAQSTMAITAHAGSSLASEVDLALLLGTHREACSLGLAPSSSTTSMMAMGDALALVVSRQRGFTREQFAKFHPAGSLGRQLTHVRQIMRPLSECRVAFQTESLRDVLIQVSRPGRRTGAIMLTTPDGKLAGVFTDSDLARLLESSSDARLDSPTSEVMTREFRTVQHDSLLPEAIQTLSQHKLSELPVVDSEGRPVGIVDVTDVMSEMSTEWSRARSPATSAVPTGEPKILPLSRHRQSA